MNGIKQETTTSEEGSTSASTAEIMSGSDGVKYKKYGPTKADLELETFDLIAKVKELLNTHGLWGPDDTYTFDDGERWVRLNTGDEDD